MSKHYPKGLYGRQRDGNGEIHEKRSDTQVGTPRKEYGDSFATDYRSDAHLGTMRQDTGKSLSELLKRNNRVVFKNPADSIP